MDPDTRITTYLQLSDTLQSVYSSPEATSLHLTIEKNYHLETQRFAAYMDVVGDTILGFHTTNELPSLLVKEVGVTPEVAKQIVADLKDFMQPVYEREAVAAVQKQADLKNLHEQMATAPRPTTPAANAPTTPTFSGKQIPVPMSPAAIPADTAPAEPVSPLDVVPMRTMAADMQRIHGYGAFRDQTPHPDDEPVVHSNQDDVLKK